MTLRISQVSRGCVLQSYYSVWFLCRALFMNLLTDSLELTHQTVTLPEFSKGSQGLPKFPMGVFFKVILQFGSCAELSS